MATNFVKKIVLISVLAACSNTKVMTREDFYTVETGAPIQDVVSKYGEPYSIKNMKDGTQEYLYIERIPAAEVTAEQNNYYIIVKNGQVVSMRYKTSQQPAYDMLYDEDPNDVPN